MSLMSNFKKIGFLFLLVGSSLNAQLFDGYGIGSGCCCPGPLNPCAWGVVVKGGVAPTFWADRGTTYLVVPAILPPDGGPVVPGTSGTEFRDQFNTGWTVGGEITYNVDDHVQLFAEGGYRQARGRTRTLPTLTGAFLSQKFDDFETAFGYLGARYYLCEWDCWGIAPFFGAKLGLQHHFSVDYSIVTGINGIPVGLGKFTYFHDDTALSAGIQLGFDAPITDCLHLMFVIEGVFTSPMRPNHNVVLPGAGPITNVIVADTGTEICVPVTLGLRWEF